MPVENVQNSELEIRMLGAFEVTVNGEPVSEKAWGRKKTRDLLKILASDPGRPFTQDQLIDLLYPEANPDKVIKNLRGRVSELRKTLEPNLKQGPDSAFVLSLKQGYTLSDQSGCRIDVKAFERHLHTAQDLATTDRWSLALEQYEKGIALYRGPFLEEDAYEEWTLDLRDRYQGMFLQGLEAAARCHGRLGDHARTVDACRRVLAQDPCRESAYRLLMRAHYHAGQQQQALAAFDACVNALKDHLSMEPARETQTLFLQISKQQLPAEDQVTPSNLPLPLTPFVGRQAELEAVVDPLKGPGCRLLTVIGPGGIGKSRLALQSATELVDRFADGAYWVRLSGVSAPDLVALAVAEALKFNFYGSASQTDQLIDFLREKQMLLVLDNFEHLIDGAAFLVEVLENARDVKLLVTSRVRLNLEAESVYALGGLSHPSAEETEGIDQYDAVRLFLNVARKADASFSLAAQRQAVVRICRQVAGVPLGIELAAAWVGVLDCQEISDEIERNLDFLKTTMQDTPQRHRSVRATFEHSWALLDASEQDAFKQLAVFRGGFTREAAAQVAGTRLGALSMLIGKSLLRRGESGRYEIHELMRQYGLEKLAESAGRRDAVTGRHAAYYAAFLRDREAELVGAHQQSALHDIGQELDNIHTAWAALLEAGCWDEVAIASNTLFVFFQHKGRYAEGSGLFEKAVNCLNGLAGDRGDAEERALACVLAKSGRFLAEQGQLEEAKALLSQSLEICDRHGLQAEKAFTLLGLGIIADLSAAYEACAGFIQDSLSLYRVLEDQNGVAEACTNLGINAFNTGDYAAAETHYGQAMVAFQNQENLGGQAKCHLNLGNVYNVTGKFTAAKEHYEACLPTFCQIRYPIGEQFVLSNLGALANHQLQLEEARRWFEAAMALNRKIGYTWGIVSTLLNLGELEGKLGQFKRAWGCFAEALPRVRETEFTELAMNLPVFVSELLRQEGQPEQALPLAAFAATHHAWDYMKATSQAVLDELAQALPAERVAAAIAAAQDRTLDDVLDEVEAIIRGQEGDRAKQAD